jgi:hypothetical protein
MAINPYQDANLVGLWEVEMIADKYFDGGVILIRTKGGWRAFFDTFLPTTLVSLETNLDKNTPTAVSIMMPNFKWPRTHKLTEDIRNLIVNFGESHQGSYYPFQYSNELTESNEKA